MPAKKKEVVRVFGIEYTRCSICEHELPLTECFSRRKRSSTGYNGACKACIKKSRKPEWARNYKATTNGKAARVKAQKKYAQTEKGKAALNRAYKNHFSKGE